MADLGQKILPNIKSKVGEIGVFRKKSMYKKSICFHFLGFLEKKIIFWGGSTILKNGHILYVSAPCVVRIFSGCGVCRGKPGIDKSVV